MHNFTRAVSAVVITLWLYLTPSSYAELFRLPPITSGEKIVYRITPKTKEKYHNKKYGISPVNTDATESYELTKTPEGEMLVMTVDTEDSDVGHVIVTNYFTLGKERIRQVRFKKEIVSGKGAKPYVYDVNFKKMGNKFPPDIYTLEVYSLVIRGLDFSKSESHRFYWWASERTVMPMYIKIKKPQEITVPAGKFLCYPVELYSDVGKYINMTPLVNQVMNPFLPVYCFWFDVNPPHNFVRFTGPSGTPGTAEVDKLLLSASTLAKSQNEAQPQPAAAQ